MNVLKTDNMKLPAMIWTDIDSIEESARKQIENLSNLPFAFHHIAGMPDLHSGYGMTIGGVLAARGVILPNAVGVDISCGMIAYKLDLKIDKLDKEGIKNIMGRIREVIPVGFEHNKEPSNEMPTREVILPIVNQQYESARHQIGTLGSGNHFWEVQKDKEDNVWIMIHSGSRNLGKRVADEYNDIAKELNQKWHSSVPKEFDLAFLPIDSNEGKQYIDEMKYCMKFASVNRLTMMNKSLKIFHEIFPEMKDEQGECKIEITHNYAQMEHHYGQNVMIHRKGATSTQGGRLGIIPGSMGTKSYITRGIENEKSFNSCSHGAGRKMGRGQATRTLSLEEQKKIMDDQGIVHGLRNEKDLDEAPGAYKDIQDVMNNQKDLVEIVYELTPVGVIKG